ncbi:MAG: hypothetical protein DME31_03820 [Verrucomicrobia bacterium]|nr:MAG: hypothetical protein DMC59_00965 [Verrucomicrobiota bacterium]PYL04366.1 MAG: hypothetical protein DME31_03820 [Verrucomicrobiota bacterium]PYL30184.1 MAG: hypothetical protein DMF39_05895 [Verrucomicrobiota bacterium]
MRRGRAKRPSQILIDLRNFYDLFYGWVKFCCKNRRPADSPIAPCEFRRSINRKNYGTALVLTNRPGKTRLV